MPYANIVAPIDAPPNADADALTQFGVRLQWARDLHVQLAVQPMISGHVESDDPRTAQQLWSTLGRREINLLIRKLREARDQAFGADA